MGSGERGLKRLIVTGDDFGATLAINEAIEKSHNDGILTSASLMVAGAASEDAVSRAKTLPNLGVGLHLVTVDGSSCLPPAEIPELVDSSGKLPSALVAAGFRFYFNRNARAQLRAEIQAQFQAFERTGLRLDHVNAHHHMHLHPTVLELILEIGRDYGVKSVRIPDERPLPALCSQGELRRRKLKHLLLSPWINRMRAKLGQASISTNDRLVGMYEVAGLDSEAMVRILTHVEDGVTEILLHPRVNTEASTTRSGKVDPVEIEYRALIHPRVARMIDKFDIELATYSGL